MHIYKCIHTYGYVCLHVPVGTCKCTFIFIFYVFVSVYVHVCSNVYADVYAHRHIGAHYVLAATVGM